MRISIAIILCLLGTASTAEAQCSHRLARWSGWGWSDGYHAYGLGHGACAECGPMTYSTMPAGTSWPGATGQPTPAAPPWAPTNPGSVAPVINAPLTAGGWQLPPSYRNYMGGVAPQAFYGVPQPVGFHAHQYGSFAPPAVQPYYPQPAYVQPVYASPIAPFAAGPQRHLAQGQFSPVTIPLRP